MGARFWHRGRKRHYGINNGTVPVATLVVDQVPAGVNANSVAVPQ